VKDYLLRFAPAVVGGVLVAFLFGFQNVQGIIIAALLALVIVLMNEIRRQELRNKELQVEIDVMKFETDKKIEALAKNTSENFGNLSGAFYEDMQALADDIGNDIHELTVLIADNRFGENE